MISVSKGIIKISNDRRAIDYLLDGSLLILLCAISTFGTAEKGQDYINYAGLFLFVGLTVTKAIFEKKSSTYLRISLHTIWYGTFILLAVASSLWAFYPASSFTAIPRMVEVLVIGICMLKYITNRDDMERFLTLMLLSFIFMTFYILAMTPVSGWLTGFLGSEVTGYNSNSIGFMSSTGVLIAFYKGYIRKKMIFFPLMLIPVGMVLLTSSRKSMFMVVVGLAMIVALYTGKKHYILRIFIILGVSAAFIVAIFKVPILYQLIGQRFASMSDYFVGGDKTADYSIVRREYFIQSARNFFNEHPIIGLGFNNFGITLGRNYANYSYAHNNYWEIASDLGIVGFITYYWFYVYLFVKLLKKVMKGSTLSILFFSYLCILIMSEYGMVTYYTRTEQMMLILCFVSLSIDRVGRNSARPKPVEESDDEKTAGSKRFSEKY